MMKYLILLLLTGCAGFTTSVHRCDYKVGLEKESCIESYRNYSRHINYREFRGGRGRHYFRSNH